MTVDQNEEELHVTVGAVAIKSTDTAKKWSNNTSSGHGNSRGPDVRHMLGPTTAFRDG